jgi:hypothetical protein
MPPSGALLGLPYGIENTVLVASQAACVALTGAGGPRWLTRLRGTAWVLVLPGSIAVVIGAIALAPGTADALTWLALVAVPPLAAAGLGWAMRGAWPPAALLAVPLLVLAWASQDTTAGELARLALIALSCISLGRLLAGLAPAPLLTAGVVAMAVVDAILVFSHGLQAPNATLNAAVPAPGLPQLQYVDLRGASMGYGDFFVAGVAGAVVAAERRPAWLAGGLTLLCALSWDLLFWVRDILPATVPVAIALLLTRAAPGAARAAGGPRSRGGRAPRAPRTAP